MADKNYKLNIEMTDGSTRSVNFTAPQGEKGDKGDQGDGVFAFVFSGNGASPVTAEEITAAYTAGRACVAVDHAFGRAYLYCGKAPYNDDDSNNVHTFVSMFYAGNNGDKIEYRYMQIDPDGVCRLFMTEDMRIANPYPLTINGQSYDGSEALVIDSQPAGSDDVFVVVLSQAGSGYTSSATYEEIVAAKSAGKACIARDSLGDVYTYIGVGPYNEDSNVAAAKFATVKKQNNGDLMYNHIQVTETGITNIFGHHIKVANPCALTINGTKYDGSVPVTIDIEGGTGGSSLPEPEGPHLQLVTDSEGSWTQEERLAYKTTGMVEVWPETAPTYDETESMFGFFDPLPADIVIGNSYTVTYNGTEYACTAASKSLGEDADGNEILPSVLGNMSFSGEEGDPDTGEPFMLVYLGEKYQSLMGVYAMMMTSDGATEATVKITEEGTIYKKVSFDYLPEGVGGVEGGVVLPEVTAEYNEDIGGMMVADPLNTPITIGSEYTVTWNGVEYKCIAQELNEDGMTTAVLGNLGAMTGGTETGEPFVILDYSVMEAGFRLAILALDGSTTATLSISGETIKKISGKYLEPSDWNADEGQDRHILNRTHWKNKNDVVILPETSVTTEQYQAALPASLNLNLELGVSYVVTWNGTDYTCVARNHINRPDVEMYLGNPSFLGAEDDTYPFSFAVVADSQVDDYGNKYVMMAWDMSTAVTISIKEAAGNVHPIPKEFMPLGYERTLIVVSSDYLADAKGETATGTPTYSGNMTAIEAVDLAKYGQLANIILYELVDGDPYAFVLSGFTVTSGIVIGAVMVNNYPGNGLMRKLYVKQYTNEFTVEEYTAT